MVQLPMPDRKASVATAHDFHRFRLVMARERHPHFEYAIDLTCRITNLAPEGKTGKYILEFIPRGLAKLADEIRGRPQPGQHDMPKADLRDLKGFDEVMMSIPDKPMPDATREFLRVTGADDGEEELRKMLGEPKLVGDAAVRCIQHEWDTAGIRCLHCGAPKP